jgi:hypothetical protein
MSTFRKSGIIPYNPAKVLRPLQEKNEAAERTHRRELAHEMMASKEEDPQFDNPPTPITAEELWSIGEHLLNKFEIGDLSLRLRTQIEKYIRGASIQIDLGQQIEKDYRATEAAQAARTARKTATERRIQGGGILSV